MSDIAAMFCDGGVIGRNPSMLGGTVCFCLVDQADTIVRHCSGIVTPQSCGVRHITNNLTELLAAVNGLEALPEGWTGNVFTDSLVTLRRISGGKSFRGIPDQLRARVALVLTRLGSYKVHLLGGHPTKAELAAGVRSDGKPVSQHNVFCDRECTRLAREFQSKLKETASV